MAHERRVSARRAIAACLAAVLFVVGGAAGQTPLTTADLVRFLKVGISERTILVELQSRGFAEALDDAREAALREAGASETLVVAVRRAVPADKAAPSSAPLPPHERPQGALPAGPVIASFASRTRTVRVPVSVLDKAGQPVIGLKLEDFKVSDEGKRQQVTLFSGERSALRIALALDVSGSMQNKIRQVEAALRHFIQLLEPVDEIMVITFSDRVHVLQDFTSDRELLGRVIDKLEPVGSTLLYDAVAEAIRRVAKGPAESKAVVIVSDGVDTGSTITFNALRELARRSEVPVFSIGLDAVAEVRALYRPPVTTGRGGGRGGFPRGPGRGPGGGRWPGGGGPGGMPGVPGGGWPGGGTGGGSGGSGHATPAGFDAEPLKELADETGGRAEIVKGGVPHYRPGSDEPENDRLKAAVESIAMTLRHRYLLGYEPPEDGGRGWRTIRVDVDRPSASARARKGYYSGA
jgi:VWFA-related protein